MPASRLGKQRALDAQTGRAQPATYSGEITLCTSAPTDFTLGTEYDATGMARQAVTFSAPTDADPPVTSNTALITFGPFTAGTGTPITHAMLVTASAGTVDPATEYHYWWVLGTSKNPGVGDSATIAIGAFVQSFSVPG
jgi:hypothetical protein